MGATRSRRLQPGGQSEDTVRGGTRCRSPGLATSALHSEGRIRPTERRRRTPRSERGHTVSIVETTDRAALTRRQIERTDAELTKEFPELPEQDVHREVAAVSARSSRTLTSLTTSRYSQAASPASTSELPRRRFDDVAILRACSWPDTAGGAAGRVTAVLRAGAAALLKRDPELGEVYRGEEGIDLSKPPPTCFPAGFRPRGASIRLVQDLGAAWPSTIDCWPPPLFVTCTRRGFAAWATGILSVSTPWS